MAISVVDVPNDKIDLAVGGLRSRVQDATVLAAAKAGDQWAFTELCNRCSPLLQRSIYRIVKNPTDTEDAIQDCYFRAFRGLHTFDERASFSTWITRIGINSALMILRKRGKHRAESMHWMSDDACTWTDMDIPDRAMGPEELYIRAQVSINLREAIGRLPDRLRCVIELQHGAEASVQEISDVLNISVPAVKSRLLRGRKALRRMLTVQSAIGL